MTAWWGFLYPSPRPTVRMSLGKSPPMPYTMRGGPSKARLCWTIRLGVVSEGMQGLLEATALGPELEPTVL